MKIIIYNEHALYRLGPISAEGRPTSIEHFWLFYIAIYPHISPFINC